MFYIEHTRDGVCDMVLWAGDAAEGAYSEAFAAEIHAAWLRQQWPSRTFAVRRFPGPVQQ